MAIAEITLFSNALGMSTVATVCMPDHPEAGKTYPVLWLLPGGGGDGSEWARYTCLENYAELYGFYAISPCTQLSLTTDMAYGNLKFYTFVTQEFPQMAAWMFPLDLSRQYVAGFSMGGYGAFKWAVTEPERFRAVGTFGGVHDMVDVVTRNHLHDGVLDRDFFLAFDTLDKLKESPNDAMWVAKNQVSAGKTLPRMFFTVGDKDFTGPFNERAKAKLEELGCKITWDSAPGTHSYLYCDSRLPAFLDWAGLTGKEAQA